MLANANPRSDVLPVPQDRTIREIEALCAKHEVPCGSPQDLATLLQALGKNKLLAMEFWSLIARATDRNPTAATDGSLLAAIVQAVTGQTLDEANSAGSTDRLLVRKFANMLAGEDIHAPLESGPFAAARDISAPAPAAREPEPQPLPPTTPPPRRNQQLRLVLDPEQQPADHASKEFRPFVVPLSAYAETDENRSIWPRILAVVLLLAVVGTGVFLFRNPSAWNRAESSVRNAFASKGHTGTPASASPAQPAADAQVQAPPIQPSAPPPVEPAPAQPAAAVPVATPPPAHAIPPPKQRDAEAESNVADTPQVVVPEALMRQNLISSRVPVAPDSAATQGIVVLQAVITSRGTVEHLRVIQGDPSLRRAAIDAAATWHYRPYLLNGTPVDVSTTISVDFAGND